eukprot:4843062-Pyramimonas_sp.AAC.1
MNDAGLGKARNFDILSLGHQAQTIGSLHRNCQHISAPTPATKRGRPSTTEADPELYVSGYNLFMQDRSPAACPTVADVHSGNLARDIGTQWRSL